MTKFSQPKSYSSDSGLGHSAIALNDTNTSSGAGLRSVIEEEEHRYRTLVEQLPAVVYLDAPDEVCTPLYVSPQVQHFLGRTVAQWMANRDGWLDFVHPEDRGRVASAVAASAGHLEPWDEVYRYVRPDGSIVWVHDQAELLRGENGEPRYWQGIMRDITTQKSAEAELAHRAFHDSLTGLPNRALLTDRITHALERTANRQEAISLLFLDLDNFKLVNDAYGHAAGDNLLQEVAARLVGCVRPGDTVARLGGDEFAILLENLTNPDHAALTAESVICAVRLPFHIEGRTILAQLSIGIAGPQYQDDKAENLLRAADAAMYAAKRSGKGSAVSSHACTVHAQHRGSVVPDCSSAVLNGLRDAPQYWAQ